MEDEETLWRDVTRKQGCGAKVKRPHNKRMPPTALRARKSAAKRAL